MSPKPINPGGIEMQENIVERIQKSLFWLVDFYGDQRKRKLGNKEIILGRNQSASSLFQTEFAKHLFGNGKFTVLVDYPVSFGEYLTQTQKRKAKTLYPDLLVMAGDTLRGVIELKLDLGFLKSGHYGLTRVRTQTERWKYSGQSNFKEDYSNLMHAKELRYKYPVGFLHPERKKIKLPSDKGKISKICMVVTKQNNHGRFEAFQESINDSGFKFLCLLDGIHPNERMTYVKTGQMENLSQSTESIKNRIQVELKRKEKQIQDVFRDLS
jgi:hypothetical protein